MIPKQVQDALDACGIAVREEGWYPGKPPQGEPYAVASDAEQPVYDDRREVWRWKHSLTLWLFTYEPVETRKALRDALMENGVPCNVKPEGCEYETKLYVTVFTPLEQFTIND